MPEAKGKEMEQFKDILKAKRKEIEMKQYELAIARSVAEAKTMPLNETKGR